MGHDIEIKSSSKDRNTLNIISKCNNLEKELSQEKEKYVLVAGELENTNRKAYKFEKEKRELENKFFRMSSDNSALKKEFKKLEDNYEMSEFRLMELKEVESENKMLNTNYEKLVGE